MVDPFFCLEKGGLIFLWGGGVVYIRYGSYLKWWWWGGIKWAGVGWCYFR